MEGRLQSPPPKMESSAAHALSWFKKDVTYRGQQTTTWMLHCYLMLPWEKIDDLKILPAYVFPLAF